MNSFKIKKYGAFLMVAFIPTIVFFMMLLTADLLTTYIAFGGAAIITTLIGMRLIQNPLSQMVEGDGLTVLTFDSTGIIRPFLVKVKPPYISGKIFGRNFTSVFDRNTVSYLANPQTAAMKNEDDEIVIKLPKKDYAKKMFSFAGMYPVLIWNSVLGEFYTKEMLAKLETETFVQHLVLYLNRKVD